MIFNIIIENIINMRPLNRISMHINLHPNLIRILLTFSLYKDSLTSLKTHILIKYRDVQI